MRGSHDVPPRHPIHRSDCCLPKRALSGSTRTHPLPAQKLPPLHLGQTRTRHQRIVNTCLDPFMSYLTSQLHNIELVRSRSGSMTAACSKRLAPSYVHVPDEARSYGSKHSSH